MPAEMTSEQRDDSVMRRSRAAQREDAVSEHTPGPWQYVPGDQYHGPYVTSDYGNTICDCYTMSRLDQPSVRNGGVSKPVLFLDEMAEPNARLIAAAPEMAAEIDRLRAEVKRLIEAKQMPRKWRPVIFAPGSIAPDYIRPAEGYDEVLSETAAALEHNDAIDEIARLRAALRKIIIGLGDTKSIPGKWMTRITKPEAYEIARAALEPRK